MKITLFAVIALLLISFTSNSQTIKTKNIYTKQMTFEIGGDIFYTSETYKTEINGNELEDSDRKIFSLNINGGIFVIDGLKLGIEPTILYTDYGHDASTTQLRLYFSPEYVFSTKTILYPYIGGSVGYTSLAFSSSITPVMPDNPTESGFSWGVKCGGKINAFGNALINIGIKYNSEAYDYTSGSNDVKNRWNILGISAGISIFFR